MSERILVVDDEARYLRLIRFNLEAGGYLVDTVASGEEALARFAQHTPDLVILDLRLPGIDGFAVCQKLREFSTVPIIMLTALGRDDDKVRGLREGADDYVVKPFSAQELLARVEAVLRRAHLTEAAAREPAFQSGDIRIEFTSRKVFKQGQEVRLTPTEYRLLQHLAAHAGRVMTQEEILEAVWGPEYRHQFEGLRVYISRLRQKLGDTGPAPQRIATHPGVGYSLAAP